MSEEREKHIVAVQTGVSHRIARDLLKRHTLVRAIEIAFTARACNVDPLELSARVERTRPDVLRRDE